MLLNTQVVFTPNPGAISSLLSSPTGAVGKWFEADLGPRIVANARRIAPQRTGSLRNSIRHEVKAAPLVLEVSANTEYALAVHEGTRPHEIAAKNAQVLRFPTRGGAVVFTPRVRHPGTRGKPYLTDALRMSL